MYPFSLGFVRLSVRPSVRLAIVTNSFPKDDPKKKKSRQMSFQDENTLRGKAAIFLNSHESKSVLETYLHARQVCLTKKFCQTATYETSVTNDDRNSFKN